MTLATMHTKDFVTGVAVEIPINFDPATGAGLAAIVTAVGQVLGKLSADPATQTTTTAILAKLSSDPSTAAGVAAVVTAVNAVTTKLSADPATAAGVTAVVSAINAVLAKLSGDPATQTTAAAILAKLSADPATAAGVTAVVTAINAATAKLSADPATQTTAAAILAKLSADPATQAGLTGILAALQSVLSVRPAGSIGTDYSANSPAFPNVAAAFGGTGPYANYVLLKTLPALATRSGWLAMATGGADVVLVCDDGTAAAGAAPVSPWYLPLSGGSAVGKQGGSTGPEVFPFKGRVQLYGPALTTQTTLVGF